MKGGFRSVAANLRLVLLVGLLQTIINYGIFFVAMQFISGALGAILMGAFPLIAAIISHFSMKNDRMSVRSVLSLAVGMVGIVIISISREPWTAAGLRELIGVVLILVTSVSSTLSNILVAKDKKGINPIILNSSQMFIGGTVILLLSVIFEGIPSFVLPLKFYLSLLWLAFISAIGFSIWYLLLKRPGVTVSGLNIWMFIVPVFGAVLSWILIPEEHPTLFSILGMSCVAVSLVTYNRIKKKSGAVL
jgi:drug/metabolite transporter (DMT)-like permease